MSAMKKGYPHTLYMTVLKQNHLRSLRLKNLVTPVDKIIFPKLPIPPELKESREEDKNEFITQPDVRRRTVSATPKHRALNPFSSPRLGANTQISVEPPDFDLGNSLEELSLEESQQDSLVSKKITDDEGEEKKAQVYDVCSESNERSNAGASNVISGNDDTGLSPCSLEAQQSPVAYTQIDPIFDEVQPSMKISQDGNDNTLLMIFESTQKAVEFLQKNDQKNFAYYAISFQYCLENKNIFKEQFARIMLDVFHLFDMESNFNCCSFFFREKKTSTLTFEFINAFIKLNSLTDDKEAKIFAEKINTMIDVKQLFSFKTSN